MGIYAIFWKRYRKRGIVTLTVTLKIFEVIYSG